MATKLNWKDEKRNCECGNKHSYNDLVSASGICKYLFGIEKRISKKSKPFNNPLSKVEMSINLLWVNA